ncbi:MAG TPA: FkbM family methyltransferase [Cyclobacteriaceae bacterium]|nr:FkbM family methyltransferase [Cyclobacteriaceae bacterium]
MDFEVYDYVFSEKYHRPYKFLGESPVILDLGVNIGLTIVDLKTEYPDSVIYGYEMDLENYKLALKNTKNLNKVSVSNCAVWGSSGKVSYSKSGNHDAYHLDAVNPLQGNCVVAVEAISINDIVKKNNLNIIDYIKMDVEGAEQNILEANTEWLEITKQIKIEVHFDREVMLMFKSLLDQHGFKTIIDSHHWSTLIGYRD